MKIARILPSVLLKKPARALAAALLIASVSCRSPVTGSAYSIIGITGTWRLVGLVHTDAHGIATSATPRESIVLFGDRHYSIGYAHGDVPSPFFAERFAPTDAEAADRFRTIAVNAGSYIVRGDTLVMSPVFSKVPELVGGRIEMQYVVDGDTLRLNWYKADGVDGSRAAYGATLLTLVRVR